MGLSNFLNYLLHEKRYSDKTVTSYQKDIEQFQEFLTSNYNISIPSANQKMVRAWMVFLLNTRQLSTSSIRRKTSSLSSYFNWLLKQKQVSSNPTKNLSGLKLPKRIPQYLTPQAINNLLATMQQNASTWQDWRDYLIIELLYSTGIRRQELIELTWTQVDESKRLITVMGKGNKERQIPIAKSLFSDLQIYKALYLESNPTLSTYILLTNKSHKLYPKFVYSIVNRWVSQFSSLQKRSPHVLRHTFATHLLNNGAQLNDIKELLGHSSLAATQVYTHNSIEDLKNIYKQAHPKS